MKVLGRCAASGIFLFAALFPVAGDPSPACAAETPRAVLVVDTGESEQRMCVVLPEDEVSGLELIVLANEQYGLSYKFGFGGEAVCMLAGVGPTGDDCFEDYPDFWGYWRGEPSGGWTWSGSGAGSTTVTDGDVEGWSWGSGNDESSHPAPPPTTYGSVCAEVSQDEPRTQARREPNPQRRRAPAPDQQRPGDAAAVDSGDDGARARERPGDDVGVASRERRARSKVKERNQRGSADRPAVDASFEEPRDDPPEQARAAEDGGAARSGPPAAGVAAVAGAGALAAAGFVLARRRSSRS